jgi:phosphomannomutase
MAKMIEDFPELEFIGGEESFRFMVGDAVREDAVAATLLICEVAARQKQKEAPFTKNYCNCM